MRLTLSDKGFSVWVSANETYNWAHRPGKSWSCSTLSNHRFFAQFNSNGLCDLTIDGKDDTSIDPHEFGCIMEDLVYPRLPDGHYWKTPL